MKIMILLSLLLTGCLNNDEGETSSGGQIVETEIAGAYQLASQHYDFSSIRRIYFTDTDGAWMRYMYDGFIKVNRTYFEQYTIEQNACALVHELAHHNGADQAEAFKVQDECMEII